MRVTNALVTQMTIDGLAAAREAILKSQAQVTSGHRFEAASEDPTSAVQVMQNDALLRAIDQYRRNANTATRRAGLEEGVLDEVTSLLIRARELAVSQASDTATAATRQMTAAEVNELVAQAVQLANTKDGDEYLFAGVRSTTAPFAVDNSGATTSFTVATPAPIGERTFEIAAGSFVGASHDGNRVFGTATAGVLKSLADLAAGLQTGGQPAVAATLGAIDAATQDMQVLLGESGARANRLQIVTSSFTSLANQLTANTSDARDIDIETAVTRLVGRQTAYQAALAATSRVLNLSLTNYL